MILINGEQTGVWGLLLFIAMQPLVASILGGVLGILTYPILEAVWWRMQDIRHQAQPAASTSQFTPSSVKTGASSCPGITTQTPTNTS